MRVASVASPLLKCRPPDSPPIDDSVRQAADGWPYTIEDQPELRRRMFEVAENLGARIVRVFWRTVDPELVFDRVAAALHDLADEAQTRHADRVGERTDQQRRIRPRGGPAGDGCRSSGVGSRMGSLHPLDPWRRGVSRRIVRAPDWPRDSRDGPGLLPGERARLGTAGRQGSGVEEPDFGAQSRRLHRANQLGDALARLSRQITQREPHLRSQIAAVRPDVGRARDGSECPGCGKVSSSRLTTLDGASQ